MTDSPAGKVEQKVEDPKPDSHQVPKARLDESLAKTRELEAQRAELEAKIKALQDTAIQPTELEQVVKKVTAPMQRELAAARMAAQNQISEDAANLILDFQEKGLSVNAAVAAARAEKPDLFVRKGDDQFRASQHGALPPMSPASKPATDEWNYTEEVKKARASGRSAKDVTIEDMRRRIAAGGFKVS